jgi:hypothetical protein
MKHSADCNIWSRVVVRAVTLVDVLYTIDHSYNKIEHRFMAYRNKDFSSALICPPVEEGKRSREVRCIIGDREWYLFAKELHRGIGG